MYRRKHVKYRILSMVSGIYWESWKISPEYKGSLLYSGLKNLFYSHSLEFQVWGEGSNDSATVFMESFKDLG